MVGEENLVRDPLPGVEVEVASTTAEPADIASAGDELLVDVLVHEADESLADARTAGDGRFRADRGIARIGVVVDDADRLAVLDLDQAVVRDRVPRRRQAADVLNARRRAAVVHRPPDSKRRCPVRIAERDAALTVDDGARRAQDLNRRAPADGRRGGIAGTSV